MASTGDPPVFSRQMRVRRLELEFQCAPMLVRCIEEAKQRRWCAVERCGLRSAAGARGGGLRVKSSNQGARLRAPQCGGRDPPDILSKWTARLELRTPASVPRRSLKELQHRWRYLIELDKAAA